MRDGVVPQLDLGGQISHPLVVTRRRLAVVSPPDVEVSLLFFCGELGPVPSAVVCRSEGKGGADGGMGGCVGGWVERNEGGGASSKKRGFVCRGSV